MDKQISDLDYIVELTEEPIPAFLRSCPQSMFINCAIT